MITYRLAGFFYTPRLQPRECMRAAEVNTVNRLDQCFADLKCIGIVGGAAPAQGRGGIPV